MRFEEAMYEGVLFKEDNTYFIHFVTLDNCCHDVSTIVQAATKVEVLQLASLQLALLITGILEDNEKLPRATVHQHWYVDAEIVQIQTAYIHFEKEICQFIENRIWQFHHVYQYPDRAQNDLVYAVGRKYKEGLWYIYLKTDGNEDVLLFQAYNFQQAQRLFTQYVTSAEHEVNRLMKGHKILLDA